MVPGVSHTLAFPRDAAFAAIAKRSSLTASEPSGSMRERLPLEVGIREGRFREQ
jgi:hypothetical protein